MVALENYHMWQRLDRFDDTKRIRTAINHIAKANKLILILRRNAFKYSPERLGVPVNVGKNVCCHKTPNDYAIPNSLPQTACRQN